MAPAFDHQLVAMDRFHRRDHFSTASRSAPYKRHRWPDRYAPDKPTDGRYSQTASFRPLLAIMRPLGVKPGAEAPGGSWSQGCTLGGPKGEQDACSVPSVRSRKQQRLLNTSGGSTPSTAGDSTDLLRSTYSAGLGRRRSHREIPDPLMTNHLPQAWRSSRMTPLVASVALAADQPLGLTEIQGQGDHSRRHYWFLGSQVTEFF